MAALNEMRARSTSGRRRARAGGIATAGASSDVVNSSIAPLPIERPLYGRTPARPTIVRTTVADERARVYGDGSQFLGHLHGPRLGSQMEMSGEKALGADSSSVRRRAGWM